MRCTVVGEMKASCLCEFHQLNNESGERYDRLTLAAVIASGMLVAVLCGVHCYLLCISKKATQIVSSY